MNSELKRLPVEKLETGVTIRHKMFGETLIVGNELGTLRPHGLCVGEFIVPDDFDSPLPEDVLADFEGR